MADLSRGLTLRRGNERFRYAAAIPQGYGKSTIGTLALPLWCLAFGHARHIAMLCASRAAAAERMRLVQRELESNERLRRDFPHLRRIDLRGGSGISRPCDLVVSGGLRLVGMYRMSPVATLSHRGHPPDLVIADDLDGQSRTDGDHHSKTWTWWDRTIEPGLGETASLVMLGTPRQLIDLLLHRVVVGPELGWTTRRYKAITRYPSDLQNLRTFEHIHRERLSYRGQTGPAAARAWLFDGGDHVLRGGEVSWREKESLCDLLLLKGRLGWTVFDALKQCRPPRLHQIVPLVLTVDIPLTQTKYPNRWMDDAGLCRGGRHEDAKRAELFPEEQWDDDYRECLGESKDWNKPPYEDREMFRRLEQI